VFRQIISIEEAKRKLLQHFTPKPVGKKLVPLLEAHGKVLAENVTSPIDVPSFSRSIVDGYAVRAEDTFGAEEYEPVKLKLLGSVNIGEPPKINLKRGSAIEVSTGAPLPEGADAVVMVEYTNREDETVLVYRPVSVSENTMEVGADIRKGQTVLKEGELLDPRKIGVLAALGIKLVNVYKSPKVAIISTGPELVEPGEPLPIGKVYDINTYTLSAAVIECGGEPISLGLIPDNEQMIRETLQRALKIADLVLTSGGVSVGPKDLIPKVLDSLGKPGIIVCGVASKPGKPTTIAVIDGKPVFSLPGQPTSSLFMFHMFVRPVLCKMAGRQEKAPSKVEALAAKKMFSAKGRRTFVMVCLHRDESGALLASPVPTGLSGAITTLAEADGFVEVSEKQQFIEAGERVTVHLF